MAQRERYWVHGQPEVSTEEEEGRACAQGTWCASPVLIRQEDGTYRREPRPGPRAFCDRDREIIRDRLGELPEGYGRLGEEMQELRRAGGSNLRMPFGPSLPLHEGIEALMREMARTLAGWHARVAAVARLTPPDPELVIRDGSKVVARAAAVLCADTHIDTLLGLEDGWMTRSVSVPFRHEQEIVRDPIARPAWRVPARDWLPVPGQVQAARSREPLPPGIAEEYADCEIVHVGADFLKVMKQPGGEQAGLDILSLHRRCERLLGEVRQHAETLDGVPCRECDDMALERAEPPSDPSRPAMYSACASCRDTMTLAEYRQWSAWYARWADGAGMECARCQRGYHEQCEYSARVSAHGGCRCMACGHLAA
jgi:hypothetical protein